MRNLSRLLLVMMMAFGLSAPAAAAWHEARSKHFIIYADLEPSQLRAFGERLERFDQAVRKLRAMDDPATTDAQRLTIFALENESAVGRLVGSSDILGLYTTGAGGSYAFVPRKEGYVSQRSHISALNIFFHEYAHHLQLSRVSTGLPAWVTEGFAEFFATAELMDNGDLRIGAPPTHLEWSVQRYSGFPIAEMLAGTLREMTGREVASLYGRGWALMHMLTFEPDRRGQLQRYVSAMQRGVEPLQAAKSAFGDDLRSLERDLDQYLRQTRLDTLIIDGKALPTGQIAIRPLRSGEAAIMKVRMQLALDTEPDEASRLAAEARRVAAEHPSDPVVLIALAQAELEARNHAAAEAVGLRAVEADPNSAAALIAVGRAKMELARQSGKAADWKHIRSWLTRANRLDVENAEPLMLFYRTYLYANERPTPNSVEGLLYAVLLAPQDAQLRIDAVRQLVVDNKLAEARRLFAPLAYHPHSQLRWRATRDEIMQALARSDRQSALQLLDSEQKRRWSGEDD